jgi:hypothetical protein
MSQIKQIDQEAARVIAAFNGPTAMARALGDITPQAISQWKFKGIPTPWAKLIKRIRPGLFGKKAKQ